MASDDREFEQCAELPFEKRRGGYREALEEIERGLGDSDSSGPLARGERINGLIRALQSHGERTLSDVLALTKTLDLPSGSSRRSTATSTRSRRRQWRSFATAGRAARRQVTNSSSFKVRAREDVALAFEMAAKLRERADGGPSGELYGLLPLQQRAAFDRDLARMVKAATAEEPVSLLMVDLDRFKAVNDVHGRQSGDQVPIGVANILVTCLSRKGKAYRYGGDG